MGFQERTAAAPRTVPAASSRLEIWIGGYPSFVGGADSELDHNIDLWRAAGIEVNLVPMFGWDPEMRRLCDARGCRTHEYHPGVFKGKVLASWCNGEFLKALPDIMEKGKPSRIIWFNCMTWTFEAELEAHRNRWIDLFGFVSEYQKGCLLPKLEVIHPVNVFEGYKPYFNPMSASQGIRFDYPRPREYFAVGRVSRDDANKFPADMWQIFAKVVAPVPVKAFVLGYGPNADSRTGPAPPGLDWQTWAPGGIPARDLYGRLHCLIHKTGGSRESYCRSLVEAMAAGVPAIVERDYAFPELVEDGVTGWLCSTSDEMSYRASHMAFDDSLRRRIALAAESALRNEIAPFDKCLEPWLRLLGGKPE